MIWLDLSAYQARCPGCRGLLVAFRDVDQHGRERVLVRCAGAPVCLSLDLPAALLRPMLSSLELLTLHPPCRECGCTEWDCRGCMERTGQPCHWVEPGLCSACAAPALLPRAAGLPIVQPPPPAAPERATTGCTGGAPCGSEAPISGAAGAGVTSARPPASVLGAAPDGLGGRTPFLPDRSRR